MVAAGFLILHSRFNVLGATTAKVIPNAEQQPRTGPAVSSAPTKLQPSPNLAKSARTQDQGSGSAARPSRDKSVSREPRAAQTESPHASEMRPPASNAFKVDSADSAGLVPQASARSTPTKSASATEPPQPDLPPNTDQKIHISGVVHEADKPIITLNGVRVDSSEKTHGLHYVVVVISTKTKRSGALNENAVQTVMNILRRMQQLRVFFSDGNYQITLAGTAIGWEPFGGGGPASISYFKPADSALALQIQKAIDQVVLIKMVRQSPASLDQDLGNGVTFRQALEASGIDIEVVI